MVHPFSASGFRHGGACRERPVVCATMAAALVASVALGGALHGGVLVNLVPSPSAPQAVGAIIAWTASVTDTSPGAHEYQFSVTSPGGLTAVVRDFNVTKSFQWTPSHAEGNYVVGVVARNVATAETGKTTQNFAVTTRLINGRAAVTPTQNPLVALFSAPPCQTGNFVGVRFYRPGSTISQTTNSIPCTPAASENFYIAGMLANTVYNMHYETLSSAGVLIRTGADLSFTTGSPPPAIPFPATTVTTLATLPTSMSVPLLLHAYLPVGPSKFVPTATDLNGNLVWYYALPVSVLSRVEPGGAIFVMYVGSTDPHQQLLREIDLAGNVLLETNANRINEQLTAAGKRRINAFHHESRRLSNGYIAVLGSNEMLVTNAQGGTPANPVDVLGAEVIVLDQNLQLVWSWDAFDHLDLTRSAVLGETCTQMQEGCPVFFLAPTAHDWLHANSIQEAPDGSLLVSLRHQDWLLKIDYAHGAGSGNVIWRMGSGGDFSIVSSDACPWFSHQHDANWQLGGMTVLSMFDNGNARRALCNPNANSRGYVLSVNESAMQVTPTQLTDLGAFSWGLGTAELLSNGNYHFEAGWILPGAYSTSIETTPGGGVAFALQEQALTYRSYRLQDMYTPPSK